MDAQQPVAPFPFEIFFILVDETAQNRSIRKEFFGSPYASPETIPPDFAAGCSGRAATRPPPGHRERTSIVPSVPEPPQFADPVVGKLFDTLPNAAILIDSADLRIVAINRAGLSLVGEDVCRPPATCHTLLRRQEHPCPECPVGADQPAATADLRSTSIRLADGNECFFKYSCLLWEGHPLAILHDVSREINLLRATDLARKEFQAKLVLQERREREVLATLHHLEGMIDHIPEALLSVDESFFIQKRNRATGAFPNGTTAQQCFELVGRDQPCSDCPAREGFDGIAEYKKRHTVDGLYFTETITPSPAERGGLLLFRETTRQIKLVEQIRAQQDNITAQNKILEGLARFGAYMQQEPDLHLVVDFFLELLLPVITSEAGAVIVNDIRPGNIVCHAEKGISDKAMNKLMRAYLSREMQTERIDTVPAEDLPWPDTRQISLLGTDGRRVGFLVFKGENVDHEENIALFVEPLGACIHNRLLMLKLEERANTDPLTGLYNRGYFHRALETEEAKFTSLNIPFAVVAADINRLKQANDLYGHAAGDLLLTAAAGLLARMVRTGDVAARTGGDEFLLLLTATDTSGAAAFVKRLRHELLNEAPILFGSGQEFPVELSLGYAGTDEVPPADLIKTADSSMYEDKESYYRRTPHNRRTS